MLGPRLVTAFIRARAATMGVATAAAMTLVLPACGGTGDAGAQPAHPGTVTSTAGSSPGSSAVSSGAGPATSTAPTGDAKPPATSPADWPSYHRDPTRGGYLPGPALTTPLRPSWSATLDGAVYAEPLVVRGTVVAVTERGSVYALDPATGARIWERNLGPPQPQSGLPCGNIDPLGITGTPAYDSATGSLFVVAETSGGVHTLWALDAATGASRWHRSLDVLPDRNRLAEQHRAALLVTQHRVITTFGGLAGDCDNYVGYATSVPTSGTGATTTYAVPTAREAGMWSPAGPVLGPNGHVYVASGNGAEVGGAWDRSDSVTELDATTMAPLSVFAPTTWSQDNRADLDLGSSSPVPAHGRIVIAGKRGTVYLLPEQFSGVGHQIAALDGCKAYGGAARKGNDVVEPCSDGLRLLHVGRASLSWGWQAAGVTGSPIIVGDEVYATDQRTSELVDVALSTGSVRSRVAVGAVTRFATPTPYAGRIYVPTLRGVAAVVGS